VNDKSQGSVATCLRCDDNFVNSFITNLLLSPPLKDFKLEMWANAQRDGRPAEYRGAPNSPTDLSR